MAAWKVGTRRAGGAPPVGLARPSRLTRPYLPSRIAPMAMPPFAGNRRRFLQTTAAYGAPLILPGMLRAAGPPVAQPQTIKPAAKARPRIGIIGYGLRAAGLARDASRHGDVVSVCDV